MRKLISVVLMVVMIVSNANFVFAGDAHVDGDGTAIGFDNTNNNTNNLNASANASSNQTQKQTQSEWQAQQMKNTYINQREFLNAPGGYQPGLPGSIDTNRHRWTSQGSVSVHMRINQGSFTAMTGFLTKAHDMDSRTRDWEDLRDDLVVQPRIDNPKSPLSDEDFIEVFPSNGIDISCLSFDEIVGAVSIRDRKIVENPVDKMYMVYGVYPYAKLAGATVIVKVDDYFREKLKSGSWGAGIGGAISAILSCFTGGAGSVNMGYSSGSSMAYIAGGELYLLLRPCPKPPAPKPCPPPEVKQPEPPPCDWTQFKLQIEIWREACTHCKSPCLNNAYLRSNMANAFYDWYECAGKTDKELLKKAIVEYDRAERDILNGREPDGVKTRDMEGAQVLLHKVRYNKSLAIKELYGEEAQLSYARNNGLSSVPETYAELKR